MTEPPATFTLAPAGDVIALDLWDGSDAADWAGAARSLRVEPRRWWLIGAGGELESIRARVADAGAVTPIGGGLVRAAITGPGWRALLMASGVFDCEDPGFATGSVAATMIHHVPVWIVVTGEAAAEVYLPASYAPTLIDLWTRTMALMRGAT